MTIKKIKYYSNQTHVLFAVIAMIFGLLFIILTPPLWGLDEQAHFARAYQITKGNFITNTDLQDKANRMPDNFSELFNYRVQDILDVVKNDSVLKRKDITDKAVYEVFGDQKFSSSENYFPVIANYSPTAYPGAILGVVVSRLIDANMGTTLFLSRLFSLIFYVTVVVLALWLVRKYKVRWLFFTLGLLPTAVFQAGMVTADNTLIAYSILFFAALTGLYLAKTPNEKRALKWIIAVSGIIIPLVKLNHILMTFAVLFIPSNKLGTKKQSLIFKTLVVSVAIICALAWFLLSQVTAPAVSQRADQAPVVPSAQAKYMLQYPLQFGEATVRSLIAFGDAYYKGMLETVSGNSVQTPLLVTIMLSIILLTLAFYAKEEIKPFRKLNYWLTALALAAGLSVFAALYAGFTPLKGLLVEGVQGRYFLPMLFPVLMTIAYITPVKLTVKNGVIASISIGVVIFSLLVSVFFVATALY